MIACTLPALTDSIPERKRKELAGEVTRELQVVGNAASIAIRTWVRSNDKSKARAEEREKNIGWIRRMFTAWRVSHTERREEREAAGEVDDEEVGCPQGPKKERKKEMGQPRSQHYNYMLSSREIEIVTRREGR